MARPCSFDREQKLDEAMQLFWQQGFESTSIRDLEQHLGLNRFSIYHSFGDKQALYHLVLDRYQQRSEALWRQIIDHSDSPLQALHNLVDSFLARVKTQPQGCLIQSALLECAAEDDIVQQMCRAQMQTLEHIIMEQFALLGWEGETREALSAFVLTHLQGLRMLGKTHLNTLVEQSAQQLKAWIERQA
ncbi:TetR/AcrR family transcriptional regulator [Celerinatantimonas sp. YJH-8]|uniref:TetR/AcrR family transcriptional regulator n=1 Tax=Celerinatantimonas sp. YJH-8 TaxID=3228714 RepID=UPI0038C29241